LANVNQQALEEMADATAHAIVTFANSTRDVNGVESPGHGWHGNKGKKSHDGWWWKR